MDILARNLAWTPIPRGLGPFAGSTLLEAALPVTVQVRTFVTGEESVNLLGVEKGAAIRIA
jgi:hypothetical protein